MEAQELEVPSAQTQQIETRESENRGVEAQEAEAQEAETHAAEAREAEAHAEEPHAWEARANESSLEEDETQLAAIRELMRRALARGVWLTLGEIAEATEFGEASISAQLRHLRKAPHGGYRVEKRRRRLARAVGAMRKIRDARRGLVTWEYRVLPPAQARGDARALRASAEFVRLQDRD
jgi:hypothetical protein